MNLFSKEWIGSVPKLVNENGCWVSTKYKPYSSNGYVYIGLNYKKYLLHRIVMCVYHNIDYYNSKIDSRHSDVCTRACFNPEHIKPGSHHDNMIDRREAKNYCSKGHFRAGRLTRSDGRKERYCSACRREKYRLRRVK